MRVGDELALIDLDALVPVRVVADHDVRTPVDRLVSDRHRIVWCGNVRVGHRLTLVLLAPMELDDHDVGQLVRPGDALFQAFLVDGAPHAVEADEPELDPAHVDHRHRTEAGGLDPVLLQKLVGQRDPLGAVVAQVIVRQVGDVRPHQGQPVDEPSVTTERESFGRDHGAAREQRRFEIDVGDVRVLRVVGGRAKRPQEVAPLGRVVVDPTGRNHVTSDE